MNYNIHPIFVHFPIALLFIYSIITILPLKTWLPKIAWRDVSRILLICGLLGSFAALATGETAEHLVQPNHDLLEAHSTFATIATWLYVLLLIGEISQFVNERYVAILSARPFLKSIFVFLQKVLTNKATCVLISLAALVCLTIAGLLGGVIVYGTSADPLAGFVLNLLGITL